MLILKKGLGNSCTESNAEFRANFVKYSTAITALANDPNREEN